MAYKIYHSQNRNFRKFTLYRKAINKCCMPNCPSGIRLIVHHVIPIKCGGTDTFDNYVILCEYCHKYNGLHKFGGDKRIKILTLKFLAEQEILGFTSDDYSEKEFKIKLRRFIKNT